MLSALSPSVPVRPPCPSGHTGSVSVGCRAFGSPASHASPRHLRLGTAGSLSVIEPAQRFSCSRRLDLAASAIIIRGHHWSLRSDLTVSFSGSDSAFRCVYLSLAPTAAPHPPSHNFLDLVSAPRTSSEQNQRPLQPTSRHH